MCQGSGTRDQWGNKSRTVDAKEVRKRFGLTKCKTDLILTLTPPA